VVGRNNVKAQVTAEVDFSRTEQTVEQHRPNLAPDASAVRSQQIVESGGQQGAQPPAGVPGAVSNQPPVSAAAPINGANPAPTAGAQGGQGVGTGGRRESVINYEVDKTTQVTRGGTGAIKRVNAAVVVNYQSAAGEGGKSKSGEAKALTPAQIDQMTALVRETIGFNKERGDSVNLMNAPFLVADAPSAAELPLWKQPETIELARMLGWPVGISLAVAIVLLGVARPALKARAVRAAAPAGVQPQGGQLDAVAAEALERPALPAPAVELQPTPEQVRLNEARTLARDNPVAVANILKTWVNGE
jgi:flagellar M-ring protein FliF